MSEHGYTPSYTTVFTVDNTPAEVFAAVNDVRGWWSADVRGDTGTAGETFVFEVPGVHYSEIEVTELIPGERVVWQVTKARITFVADQSEWAGTVIRFDITETDGGTELRFTHNGLVPSYECYDACSNAWSLYVGGSLRNLVTTGTGQPSSNPEEQRFQQAARA